MRGIICAKTGLGKAHYIDSFAGMMSSLRKIAGKTNIPSSPRDKSIHRPKTADRFRKNLRYGSILKGYHKKKAIRVSGWLFSTKSVLADGINPTDVGWNRFAMKSRFAGRDRADLISSEAVRRRFHPNGVRISSCIARFHWLFWDFMI